MLSRVEHEFFINNLGARATVKFLEVGPPDINTVTALKSGTFFNFKCSNASKRCRENGKTV